MKEEALKLADELAFHQGELSMWTRNESCRMIRRLVEELDKKSKPINHYEPTAWINHIKQTGGDFYELNVSGRGEPLYRHPPQTKPLSDEEIEQIAKQHLAAYAQFIGAGEVCYEGEIDFARAIEERHGIK